MLIETFYHLQSKPDIKQKTITELCLNKDTGISFLQSDIKMIDFDELAKDIGNSVCSPDGLALVENTLHFIEFKDQKIHNIKISDCLDKLYQGLSVFGLCADKQTHITPLQIVFTIICNPAKNHISTQKTQDNNPFARMLNDNLAKTNNQLSDLEISQYEKQKNGKFQSMKKLASGMKIFGIDIKVDILLIQQEIDDFLIKFKNTINS